MNRILVSLTLTAVASLALCGCSRSNEIKEPSREGFNSGELSPSTSDKPEPASKSFTLD